MESFEEFMELFGKWKQERNNNALATILKNGPAYFTNLSTSEIGFVLSVFLSEKAGLVHFLVEADFDKSMESSIIEGFKLLSFIITQFYWLLNQYTNQIKKVCESAIITKCSQYIKGAAVDCFENLVRRCPNYELKLNETVRHLVNKFHLCTPAERAKFFKALGIISKYQPEAINSWQGDVIFNRIMDDYDKRYSLRKFSSQSSEVGIYLNVLNDLFTNFPPPEPQGRVNHCERLYQRIKELSTIDLSQRQKFVSRAAISLLGRHMSLFEDYIYKDALFWHDTLLKWSTLYGENQEVAAHTLMAYYKTMGIILSNDNTSGGRSIFEQLKKYLEDNVTKVVDSAMLQLSISGFGHMAGPCKNYLTEKDVSHMFLLLACRATVMYAHNNEMKGFVENVVYYLDALSEILLQMSSIVPDQLNAIATLSLVLIKHFPDLPVTDHSLAVQSLLKTSYNIRCTCRRSYQEFITKIVYEGIVWSCSHSLYIDAETEREMKNLTERPICYKNYLPLWQSLLSRNNPISTVNSLITSAQIFDAMIETCIKVMKKLNLNVRTVDVSGGAEEFDLPVAVNDTDFRVFINLVDLLDAIFEKLDPTLMNSKVRWFLCEVIRKSNRNPLISGFYRLVQIVLKMYSSHDSGEQELLGKTFQLLTQYLSDTIEKLPSFSGELQISCFNLIFKIPVPIAENMLDRLSPTFKAAFTLRQDDFSLAKSALGTLEKWTKAMKAEEQLRNFLIEVIPSLETFLQSDQGSGELVQDVPTGKKVKHIVLTDDESTMHEFQRKILLFFGSLNSEVTLNLAADQFTDNRALSEKKLLKYTLLYSDIQPDIHLDTILPRTIELALNSTERRTRVIACEVLHSVVTVMLGRSMQLLSSNPDHMLPLFEKICPAILRLGSDSDQIIQQLFYPLMIQLTHWYSSKLMLRSSETVCLIETLFDLLTYESNMALSDFCGVCLAEFVKWSIKQSTDSELQTSSTNIQVIVSKITNFALHPTTCRRIGAAVAFNYLYTLLRESDAIIDMFWLELLACFIKSLDGCSSTHIMQSLKHIEKVISIKYDLLNSQSFHRRKPAEFEGTLLRDAADWLLTQCASTDQNRRTKSMEELELVSKHVPEFISIQGFFTNYVNRNGMRSLNQIILKDLHPKMECLSLKTMKPLMRTLDCYIWILNNNIMSLDLLFTDKNANKDMIFNCTINFVYLVNVKREKTEESIESINQYQEQCLLKHQIILKIFDFIITLLSKIELQNGAELSSYVPGFFWNDELCSLISSCIFVPEAVGFDLQNLDMIKSLASNIQQLLTSLIQKFDTHKFLLLLKESIAKHIESKHHEYLNLDAISTEDISIPLNNYVKGLIMLETFDQHGRLYNRSLGDDESANRVVDIFNLLNKQQYDTAVAVTLESSTKEYLKTLVKFLTIKFEEEMATTLLEIVGSQTKLSYQNSSTICHGEYFMNLFGVPIFQNLLTDISRSLDILLRNSLTDKFDSILVILEELMMYVKQNKNRFEKQIPNVQLELVNRFSNFRDQVNYMDKRKEKLINLYSLVVQVSPNPSEICKEPNNLYAWMIQELLEYLDLEYKTRILNAFLPCIVDGTSHKNKQLSHCLHKLKTGYYTVNMNNLIKGSLHHSNVIACFQTLSRHLPLLESVALFECVIDITIDNVEYFWDSNATQHLTTYFDQISAKDSLASLAILYKFFMTTQNFEARLEILKKVLLKCIHLCNANVIEQFCEQNIRELYNIARQDLHEVRVDLKNLIVSKIGCYNLLEIMLAKVPLAKLTSADSNIVQNAVDTIETGRELFQGLYSNFLGVRKLKSPKSEVKELMRLLHCAAYNCSIGIVSLKSEERFYNSPFAEKISENQLIWEKIIDTERKYEFKQDFKEIPKEYKKLVNIRRRANLKTDQTLSNIKSYNLAASTLNEDLACFDLYECNLRSDSIGDYDKSEEMMSLSFEVDDLNNHECMAPICGIITHMVASNIFSLPEDGEEIQMPNWMQYFQISLKITTAYNVKFFMVKVILNVQNAFKPYARFFIAPLLSFLNSHFTTHYHMNYLIKDILVMLIDWHSVAIPCTTNEKQMAQNLLAMLLKNGDSQQRQLYKYNVEIINQLVQAWQSILEVPNDILSIPNASDRFIVRIIHIFVSNNKEERILSNSAILMYLVSLVDDPDEETILYVCNALGLIMKYLESRNEHEDSKERIITKLQTSVIKNPDKNHNTFIKCIYEIHIFYPKIVSHCFKLLTISFFKVDDAHKEKCLELFLSALPNFDENEIITELGFIRFQDILKNKIFSCQSVALKIIEKLLHILSPSDYLPFAQLILPYAKNAPATQKEIIINISMAIWKKYSDNIDDNLAVGKLKHLSRNILLLGLLDTNESVQKKLLQFWIEHGHLPDKSIGRVLEIFDMYDPDLETSYLPILPLLMLHLVSKDPQFEKKMFEPLSNCKFEDYQVAVQWRSKHAGLLAPLFTSSLANRMSQYYSQSNPTFARFNQSLNHGLFLRASQSMQFKQTLSKDQSFLQSAWPLTDEHDSSVAEKKRIPEPSKNRKSKRLLQYSADISKDIRYNRILKNMHRDEISKNEIDRRRSSVKMYRKYRIGDFPDTGLTHAGLILPLEELVRIDQVVAKKLTVAMLIAMVKEMLPDQKADFLERLSVSLNGIVENSQGSKPLIATVLELILNFGEIYVCSNTIAKVSKSCGLLSLGALLLEEKMISGYASKNSEPASKKSKSDNHPAEDNSNWIQLANIYKLLNDFDIIQSIFGCAKFGKGLQDASLAQAAGKWAVAKSAYEKSDEINNGLAREYCQESLFICLAHLSDWKQIDQHVKKELNKNYDALWLTPISDNWMVPWVLQLQIHKTVNEYPNEAFVQALNKWVNDKDKLSKLKELYGEEMAVFFIQQNFEFSQNCLMHAVEKVRLEWKHLNLLYFEQKIHKYLNLRGLSDIKTYLNGIKDKNQLIPNAESIISFWSNSVPANQDNLLLWDKQIAYRLYFLGLLVQQINDAKSSQATEILGTLNVAVVKQCLNITHIASCQSNSQFVKKYLRYSERYLKDVDASLEREWRLAIAKYKYLCYADSQSIEKKQKNYIASWELSHDLIKEGPLNTKLELDIRQHISTLVIELQILVINQEPICEILLKSSSVSACLPLIRDRETILKQLSEYCLTTMKKCYESADAKGKSECYLKVSTYCHSMNSRPEVGFDLSKEFIHSTLSAMSYGSLEASQYFPCLLHLEYSSDPELGKTFESASENVQTWMFLKWQAQLLSHIGNSICSIIAPILLSLAEKYPNAFIYAFRMTKEMNKSPASQPIIEKLTEVLSENKDLELFLEAMRYLVQPELYLKYHWEELEANMKKDADAAVNTLLNTVYPTTTDVRKGKLWEIIAKWQTKVKELTQLEGKKFFSQKAEIFSTLNESLENRIRGTCTSPLKGYSPWLYQFRGGDIEVPGQYSGDREPLPQHHAKIVKLNSSVMVLPSLRKPVKITFLGTDGKHYSFLVKYGEDLRVDERIEQLFMLMNRILQGDAACRQRRLSIDTYLVIPLTRSLGMIQWVENTRSLSDLIDLVSTDREKTDRKNIMGLYLNWISTVAGEGSLETKYKKALLKCGREEVTNKFALLKSKISWDTLRNSFKTLSSSPECFFAFRHNFVTSFATICVTQWILGIGDRNLSNTLISHTSGKALGIDFGCSFDAAVDSSIPELMPFRLTPQILGLLQPFDENGLLKMTMINVLRALRNRKEPLIACMDIFIKEPTLDWLARKKIPDDRQENIDVRWYPKKKINMVIKKMNGTKPSKLTSVQLEDRYSDTEYFSKYIDIINGSNDGLQFRARSAHKDEDLSVEEQVECLLDQATDPNILARTWHGWEPWI